MSDGTTAPVFWAPAEVIGDARPGDVLLVTGDEAKHAVRVRRLQPGEPVTLADGHGGYASGVVAPQGAAGPGSDGSDHVRQAPRGEAVLAVSVRDAGVAPAPSPAVWVVQALAKGDRAEQAVESLTEVGVDRVVPWAASRSIVRWSGERGQKSLERWRRVAGEASKQSRRRRFCEVADLHSTAQVAALIADAAAVTWVLHEHAASPLEPGDAQTVAEQAGTCDGPRIVVLVVGPEGGITSEELSAFTGSGARAARMGPTVMRTSTAGTAAAAVVLAAAGRWA